MIRDYKDTIFNEELLDLIKELDSAKDELKIVEAKIRRLRRTISDRYLDFLEEMRWYDTGL